MTNKLREKIQQLPHSPGVYVFRDAHRKPLYVGKSVDLRNRVHSYFQKNQIIPPKTADMIQSIADVEIIETDSEIEALLLEASLIQSIQPFYNSALKDDKRFNYLKVTDTYTSGKKNSRVIHHPKDAYPHLTTERYPKETDALYFGPFPDGRTVHSVIRLLRLLFGWCSYSTIEEVAKKKKPCFYYHIKQCPGYCAGIISHQEYLERIDAMVLFLQGKKTDLVKTVTRRMRQAADDHDFEKAQAYKEQIERLQYVTQSFRTPENFLAVPVLREEHFYFAREELRTILGTINLDWAAWLRTLERIEGYDISNTQGKNPTGSMVVFESGIPQKSHYRRFKIRDISGPNDPAMMAQMLRRRLKYLQKKSTVSDESFASVPQLLVIDGGKGQISAVREVLKELNLQIPVIGLAKREEILVVPKTSGEGYEEIVLSHKSPTLQLIQQLRDEAHRFAKSFHVLLRKKNVFA